MTKQDPNADQQATRQRPKRIKTGPLEPLPDRDRISSIGTVRTVPSELTTQAGDPLAEDPLAEDALAEDALAEDASSEDASAEDASAEDASAEDASAEDASAEDASTGGALPVKRRAGPLGRKRAITNVWTGGELDRRRPEGEPSPTIGERYRIVEKVGAGGMSEIYRVRHVHMDKDFALKVIDAKPDMVARMRQIFLREAKTASQLDHPHVVQIIDFGVDDDQGSYIVMEYLKGETLFARLGRVRRLKVHQALQITLQVAEALHHMHGVDIIHCDVKAENVFMCRTPPDARQRLHVKMIDFGLSRPRTWNVKLAAVEVGGTPQYMAPELIKGESPQPSMDIYGLGNLLYEMLAGRLPFTGSMARIIEQQLHEDPAPPSQWMDEPLESRVEEVILEMLQKNPADRQRSMGQVIFQLRTVMAMYDFPGARPRRTTTAERPAVARRRPPLHQGLVDHCPFPMYQLDCQARIVYANDAFCHFVQDPLERLRGRSVADVRLALVYPSIETDVLACVRKGSAEPMQRAFSFELTDGRHSSMLSWLKAQLNRQGLVERVNGSIHPVD